MPPDDEATITTVWIVGINRSAEMPINAQAFSFPYADEHQTANEAKKAAMIEKFARQTFGS